MHKMVEMERKEVLKNLNSELSSLNDLNKEEQKLELLQKIGSHDEAPHYMKDNEYIKHGYRINYNTFNHVFKS